MAILANKVTGTVVEVPDGQVPYMPEVYEQEKKAPRKPSK